METGLAGGWGAGRGGEQGEVRVFPVQPSQMSDKHLLLLPWHKLQGHHCHARHTQHSTTFTAMSDMRPDGNDHLNLALPVDSWQGIEASLGESSVPPVSKDS